MYDGISVCTDACIPAPLHSLYKISTNSTVLLFTHGEHTVRDISGSH